MTKHTDFPFDDVTKKAEALVNQGHDCYQKFTCAGCGQRLTMETPNQFYEEGTCDKCDTVTNIKQQGCNFLLHARIT